MWVFRSENCEEYGQVGFSESRPILPESPDPGALQMAFINLREREIQIKIIYYGPANSGKTTNLQHISAHLRNSLQSKLLSITPDGRKTVFFDFMVFTMRGINEFDLKVRLYTVPGGPQYAELRKTLLKGTDGIVFVVDSSAVRNTNMESLLDLSSNLQAYGKSLARMPLVFQVNKFDLGVGKHVFLPTAALLNDPNHDNQPPYFLASATEGRNVFCTLKKIISIVMDQVDSKYRKAVAERNGNIDLAAWVRKELAKSALNGSGLKVMNFDDLYEAVPWALENHSEATGPLIGWTTGNRK